MAKKKERREVPPTAEVPMAPMIDVVFQLMLYFILTYHATAIEAHMAVNLPSPSAPSASKDKPKLLEVYVLANDEYVLMGTKSVTLETLGETLIGVASYDPDQTVIIKVDKEAREESLIALLDLCRKANLTQINVLSLKEGVSG